MKIEFWSDIICPFCGLTDHRLRRAIERFAHGASVEVVHRSFQLHPDLPRTGVTQRELITMAGAPASTVEQVLRPIERAAHAEGLDPYRAVDRTLGPTDFAHELLAYATDQGRGAETWAAMFRAHFGTARKLWTREEVLDFAGEIGLDGAGPALHDRRYRDRVAADQHAALSLGASGAPFLVFDDTYAVPGALETDRLVAVLEQVWAASHRALPVIAASGDTCGVDGCY
ncbi:putative DsbA family dithiol-disulfide isomerase [Asanoa ferruginea]|uniref:Putative DsbA family dithiol-disulfide isomerase n=1 Tax=Asanoa ferruginea TaxID=53367 RepID=A0A3D9ZZ02_9ACTN|nr:DsbA family protein [Asanoa ferruginea]REG02397.1 putative DsbA family dithiol-disulfide isomerase [Asanoa ferruginea]GIF46632.1 protein disulfide-isomerase [Asanoa ferruginea]